MYYELKYSLRSSVIQFCFWGMLLISSSIRFRSLINEYIENVCILLIQKNYLFKNKNFFLFKNGKVNQRSFVSFYIYYAILLLVFLFTLVSEKRIDKIQTDTKLVNSFLNI